ncbi:hypothetical protein [Actinomadura terrae]|uniref:hypothetical protein n=1 Tax=Actinomadura terrae TaxID=604353 RepID=UPI001FA7FBCB|nr:hypothetical protein [Actinomadura terrae]
MGHGKASAETTERPLILPVTITATKPLLPTHVKGFLWVDVLFRATRLVADPEYHWSPRTPNLTGQTIQFWDHLDRRHGTLDFDSVPPDDLGRLYVRFHSSGDARPLDELRHYIDKVEHDGWVHPATRAMSVAWKRHLDLLGVRDPGLLVDRPLTLSTEETVERLVRHRLCLDHRRYGGPVYMDGTRWGMPLRKVIGADGHANYLLVILRDLLPRISDGRQILFVYDEDLAHDYALVGRIASALGARPSKLPLGRVPIGGALRSSRYGGWDEVTIGRLSELCLGEFGPAAYRLGMRLYFIAMLKRTSGEPFRPALLRRALLRAERMLRDAGDEDSPDHASRLLDSVRPSGWADPYRLTDGLFAGRTPKAARALLEAVYL